MAFRTKMWPRPLKSFVTSGALGSAAAGKGAGAAREGVGDDEVRRMVR